MASVVGIGNALVDIIIRIDDEEFLNKVSLPKGSMTMIDAQKAEEILGLTSHFISEKASGGAVSNTINGLASLGIHSGYIGKIGRDEIGKIFLKDIKDKNIAPHLLYGESTTGRAITLVSPDGERTFGTFLGAATEMSAADLESRIFKNYEWLMAEGYLIYNRDLITAALKMAKDHQLKIAMDMASYNLVEENRDFIISLLEKYVDVVFANEQEARALTKIEEPGLALKEIGKLCRYAVVKLGEHGSIIMKDDQTIKVQGVQADCIDTTGAGDLYAAGFLYGLIKGKSLLQCGEIGSLLGANVVETIGAKINEERWIKIRKLVEPVS